MVLRERHLAVSTAALSLVFYIILVKLVDKPDV
jgi:hypothetical protein